MDFFQESTKFEQHIPNDAIMDIEDIIQALIDQNQSIDFVESEFQRRLNEDAELKEAYLEWCDAQGLSPKMGYIEYIEEVIESRNSVWNTLSEFGDDE